MDAPRRHHVEPEIALLRPEEGGRSTPVRSGYRSPFHYDGRDCLSLYDFGTDDWMEMGQTVHTRIWFMMPDHHLPKLYSGKEFFLREGERVVARGKITRVSE